MSIKHFVVSTATLALLISFSSQAQDEKEREKADEVEISVAIGVMSETSPFTGVGSDVIPVIAPNIEYGDFYWRANELGYKLLDKGDFELSTILRPLVGFDLEAKDLPEGFGGIEDRDGKMEYGFTATYDLGSVQAEFTPLYNGEGLSAEFALNKGWFGQDHMIILKGFARYDSADYQDYYFGISDIEATDPLNTSIDASYSGESSISFGAQLIGTYELNESWYVLGMLEYLQLDSSIENSALIDETSMVQIAVGIGYKF